MKFIVGLSIFFIFTLGMNMFSLGREWQESRDCVYHYKEAFSNLQASPSAVIIEPKCGGRYGN